MILTGRYVSPFVRRVAIWLALQGRAFTHQPLMVTGEDFAKLRQINPIGRVPALTLDDGTTLIETWAIIDYLEETAPAGKRLLPERGPERMHALQMVGCAHNVAEKAVALVYETTRRPAELHYSDWIARVSSQVEAGLAQLEAQADQIDLERTPGVAAAAVAGYDFVAVVHPHLVGERYRKLMALSGAAAAHPAFAASKPVL